MTGNNESSSVAGGSGSGSPSSNPIPAFRPPSREEMMAQELFNNCAVKAIISGVMGGGMGVMFGMLFGALEQPIHVEEMTLRQQLTHGARQMARSSWTMAKTFAVMGTLFSGAECIVEKARAKHDVINTAAAGCATGGILAARAGPQAACVGCAGFATFSILIEKVLERYH